MNYLTALMVISGLFFSTSIDKPNKVNFEKLKDVDREFVDFLSSFEKTDLPYEMTIDDMIALEQMKPEYKKHRNDLLTKYVTGNHSGMKIFSRGGPPIITPLKRFYPSEKTVAVSYLQKGRFRESTATVMIAVFTLKGKLVGLKEKLLGEKHRKFTGANNFMSSSNHEDMETFRITENGIIHKTTYNKVWEKDIKQHGIENNNIISYDLLSQETLQLSEDGYLASLDKKNDQEINNIALKP